MRAYLWYMSKASNPRALAEFAALTAAPFILALVGQLLDVF